jgi:hypothetical protein
MIMMMFAIPSFKGSQLQLLTVPAQSPLKIWPLLPLLLILQVSLISLSRVRVRVRVRVSDSVR